MGGSTNERVPAWKLRQQQRQQQRQRQGQNGLSVSLKNGDELGGPRQPRGGDLDQKPNGTTTTRVPAWKLREQMKRKGGSTGSFDDLSVASGDSRYSYQSRATAASTTSSKQRAVSMVPEDPNLPPAFRAVNKLQSGKRDDFNSLCSVHSRSVTSRSRANGSRMDGRSATNSYARSYGDHDAFEFLESDSDESSSLSCDGSFASLGSDADEDDEAYRQSRNQMARMTIETQKQPKDSKRVGKSRFKKIGTPLDFIAE